MLTKNDKKMRKSNLNEMKKKNLIKYVKWEKNKKINIKIRPIKKIKLKKIIQNYSTK